MPSVALTRLLPLVLVVVATVPGAAAAHPLAPLLLEIREVGAGSLEVGWKTPLLLPQGTTPAPALPARCRPQGAAVTATEDTGVRARWTVDCGPGGLMGERIGV